MKYVKANVSPKVPFDPEATAVTPIPKRGILTGCLSRRSKRLDTPLLPPSFRPPVDPHATITVLTGIDAGRLTALDGAALTIGRAADADLVVEGTGVSRRHARIARAAGGDYYAEDLGSTNGTFLGTNRIGVALLRDGARLQLGPNLQLGFAIIDSLEQSLHRRLYEASVRDPLTHAFNRRYLHERLIAEIAHARRSAGDLIVCGSTSMASRRSTAILAAWQAIGCSARLPPAF